MGKSARDYWLGMELVSKTGRKCKITEYNGCKDVVIRFEDDVEIHRETNTLKLWPPCHPDDNNLVVKVRVGDVYDTNRFGKVVITKYEGNKKVTVQFIDYPDEFVTAQMNAIERGLVTPHFYNVRTLERWKETATKKHSGRYDYSNVKEKPYNHQDILIHCNYCGNNYSVNAALHMNGGGHCSCKRTSEVDAFYGEISSKTQYKIDRDSVRTREIDQCVAATCEQHGSFEGSIRSLTEGRKCPTCELVDWRLALLEEKKEILQGVEVLGFTEDYRYILLDTTTGEIKTYNITDLKKKTNSPFVLRVPEQRVTLDVFKQRAFAVHGDAYSYSDYLSIGEKVTITHKECGNTYKQAAAGHINGNYGKGVGCPYCAKYGLSLSRPTNLYILLADNGYVKVGITHQTPEGRIRQIHKSTRAMFLFKCYKSWNMIGKDAVFAEHEILTLLRQQYKQPSEIFDGSSETFVGTSPPEIAILIEKFLEGNSITLLK